jgi:hypothetical protein
MDDVGAVRIQHALGITRRARGVAHRGGGVLVECPPFEVTVALGDPVLVRNRALQRGLRHVRSVGQDHIALDAREFRGDLLQHWHEGEVGDDDAILGVIDDPGDLLRKQPRVTVWQIVPMPMMPYQHSRWRAVFQAMVAMRSPSLMPTRSSACETLSARS